MMFYEMVNIQNRYIVNTKMVHYDTETNVLRAILHFSVLHGC